MVTKCHQCGKRIVVLYPHLWAYKRAGDYYCTWSCLRTFENSDKGEIPVKLSEKSMAAIKIAMEGGDPVEYLKGRGSKNPSAAWCSIKAQLKEKAPELLQKVMDAKKAQEPAKKEKKQKPAEPVKTAKITEAVNVEPAEPKKIDKPVVFSGMTVREVEGNFGRYRRSDVHDTTYIDFEYTDGADTISLTVEQWASFRTEMLKAAAILGVEL